MENRYKQEIERIYIQLYALLFEYGRSVLSSDALAEEAVQEAFRIACQKPEALLGSPNPEGWMVNTLKNVLKNTVRNQNTARRILGAYMADDAKVSASSEDLKELELLYGDIVHTEEFKLVKAVTLDGRSYLEVARELGISVAACRKRMERARAFLRKKIKK